MNSNVDQKTDIKEIKKKSKKIKGLIGVFVLFLFLGTLIMQSLISSQKGNLDKKKLEIANLIEQIDSKQGFYQFLETNEEEIKIIQQALPDEDNLVNFVDEVDLLLNRLEIKGSLHFSSLVASKAVGQMQIPFNIKMTTTIPKLLDFLPRLERLPYIVQLTSVSTTTPDGVGGEVSVSVGAKIYVQDPFEN